jgi:hypothetical protein
MSRAKDTMQRLPNRSSNRRRDGSIRTVEERSRRVMMD